MMMKDGKKLSKSLGNSIYVKDMLKLYHPEALKIFLNKGQYNQSQEFDESEIVEANHRWETFVENIPSYQINTEKTNSLLMEKVMLALEDDFNTPQALVELYAAFKELNVTKSLNLASEILQVSKLLSIVPPDETLDNIYTKWSKRQIIPDNIRVLIEDRQIAKNNKNYALADSIRKKIQDFGWEIKDGKNGFNVKRMR